MVEGIILLSKRDIVVMLANRLLSMLPSKYWKPCNIRMKEALHLKSLAQNFKRYMINWLILVGKLIMVISLIDYRIRFNP
jgi:hypothetical protein